MENLKDLKKQENVLNDDEVDQVTGGMITFSTFTTDSTKYTAVLQVEDGGKKS